MDPKKRLRKSIYTTQRWAHLNVDGSGGHLEMKLLSFMRGIMHAQSVVERLNTGLQAEKVSSS